jgi:hypothetical protein
MWPKRFLTIGLLSAVPAAAVALILLALLLAGIQSSGAVTMQVRNLAVFGIPGIVVYPACWYALIYRRRRYGTRDTVRLVAWTFAAKFLLLLAVIVARIMVALAAWAHDLILKGVHRSRVSPDGSALDRHRGAGHGGGLGDSVCGHGRADRVRASRRAAVAVRFRPGGAGCRSDVDYASVSQWALC